LADCDPWRSASWKFARPSEDPMMVTCPGVDATSAGRLSSTLSECDRYTGPVHWLPSYDIRYSVQTVPSGFHHTGVTLRYASQMRPDGSIASRGEVFFGATRFNVARFAGRCSARLGSSLSQSTESFWRPRSN